MYRVISRLRCTMPMRLCCMSHTRQHASNTNNRPSLASTNNGGFGLFSTMPHEHGAWYHHPLASRHVHVPFVPCRMLRKHGNWEHHVACAPSHAHGEHRRLHRTASPWQKCYMCLCSTSWLRCSMPDVSVIHATCSSRILCMLHHAAGCNAMLRA